METVTVRETGRDSRATVRENLLRDFVRFSWKATRGLTSAAETEGETLVQRMVDLGRLTSEQGARLLTTLDHRMKQSRADFEQRVDEAVRQAADRLGEISLRELNRLSQVAADLEAKVDRRIKN